MNTEESVHFRTNSTSAKLEWDADVPVGTGAMRLGPRHRPFSLSMFHQLHCLGAFHTSISGAEGADQLTDAHNKHCLDYMRQVILCDADVTLEEGDFMERVFEVDREGQTHVCQDWNAIYTIMSVNFGMSA